jgi:hypothetical protein
MWQTVLVFVVMLPIAPVVAALQLAGGMLAAVWVLVVLATSFPT